MLLLVGVSKWNTAPSVLLTMNYLGCIHLPGNCDMIYFASSRPHLTVLLLVGVSKWNAVPSVLLTMNYLGCTCLLLTNKDPKLFPPHLTTFLLVGISKECIKRRQHHLRCPEQWPKNVSANQSGNGLTYFQGSYSNKSFLHLWHSKSDRVYAVYWQHLINSNVMWLNSINFKQTWASKTCLKMQQAALVSKSCYRSVYHFGLNWIYVHFQTKISRHWNLTWYQSCLFHTSWTSKCVINT